MAAKPKKIKLYPRWRFALADTDSVRPHEFEERLQFPCFGSFKKDGIRAGIVPVHPDRVAIDLIHHETGWLVRDPDVTGHALTRSIKYIQNTHIRRLLETLPHGLDGELAVVQNGKVAFKASTSAVMSEAGEPDFVFYVFDHFLAPGGKADRLKALAALRPILPDWVVILEHRVLNNAAEARAMFKEAILNGDEGVMFAAFDGPYKPNRSTVLEGYNVKSKDKADLEGVCIGTYEEFANNNEATIDERGYTKRTTHKANKVGKGRVGGLLVIFPEWPGKVARIAAGLNDQDKAAYHLKPPLGQFVKMSYALAGDYELPRHGVFEGIRDPKDMDPSRVAVLEALYAAYLETASAEDDEAA